MKRTEVEIAKLCAVSHDRSTDEVTITFRVTDEEYKNLVFRLARRDDIEWIIRGDKLDIGYQED